MPSALFGSLDLASESYYQWVVRKAFNCPLNAMKHHIQGDSCNIRCNLCGNENVSMWLLATTHGLRLIRMIDCMKKKRWLYQKPTALETPETFVYNGVVGGLVFARVNLDM